MAGFVMFRPLLFLCLTLLLLGGQVGAASVPVGSLQVKAIGVMDRFAPFEAVTGTGQVGIFAARNEYEGFQFVISAGKPGVAGVTAEVSPLRNAAGDSLEVNVFRERYVRVSQPSPFSPYPPQSWPDILLPAKETAGRAAGFRAFPQDLAAGENLPVWVEVHVPADARPGQYHGTVTVTAQGADTLTLPVILTVWDFALPQRSPLRTVFGTNGFRVAEVYGFGRTGDNAADNHIIRAYNDFLLDHYLSPESFWDAIPVRDGHDRPGFGRQFAGLGTVTENMRHYMQDKHATVYTYEFGDTYPFDDALGKHPAQALRYMADYADWCERLAGEPRRCYTNPSFLDEPNSADAYAAVRRWGRFFDEASALAGKPVRFQVSEPPIPDDPAWGNLYGAVDVWVPRFYDLWRDVDDLRKNVSGERLGKGEELWAYTSLVVDMDEYRKLNPRADTRQGSYPPVWQLDYPAINYRIPTWFFHQYGVTGLGYWETFMWFPGADVWNDAASFKSQDADQTVFNGDGLLVYPGYRTTVGFDGPVASLRLKWIRESVEDYMYLDLLWQAGEKDFVNTQVHRFARNLGDWDNDPAMLMQVRQQMGERLQQLFARKGGDAS